LLASLRNQYDFILIDTPSVLAESDAVSITQSADGVVLVLATKADAVPMARESAQLLKRFDVRLIGCIINDHASRMAHSTGRYAMKGQTNEANIGRNKANPRQPIEA
jgi:Mrp family chromosome partitioning ATPase